MLRQIREKTGNLVVKVIMGILVLSFGAWGIGDMLKVHTGDKPVAKIGSKDISQGDLEEAVRKEINRLNPQFGNQLTPETARMLGLPRSVLGRMINQTLLLEEAQKLGIAVSDNLVREDVQDNPMFQTDGKFDRQKFQSLLFRAGLNENEYVVELRRQIARTQITDSLSSGVVAPDVFADRVYRYREEQRVAETLFLSDSGAQVTDQPSEADLKAYHQDHKARFTAPEYRTVTLAIMRAGDLVDAKAVTEDQIEKAFKDQAESLSVPERRKLLQMFLPDKATAEKARAQIVEGHDFVAVAKDLAGMDAAGVNLGEVTKKDTVKEIADAAFATSAGGVTQPLPGPGGAGYYLVKVVSVTPGHDAKLADVKEQLRQRVAREKATDALYTLVNKMEDELGKNISLEDVAKDFNLKLIHVAAVDHNGNGPDGKPVQTLPKDPGTIVSTVFETDSGTTSTIRELGNDAFYVLRVDGVTPPTLRPFAKVKDQVKEDVMAERRRDATLAVAKQAAERVKKGESLEAVAKDIGATYSKTKTLKRYYSSKVTELPNQLLQDIFGLKDMKDAAVTRGAGGYYVSHLEKVIPAEPDKDKAGVAAAQKELTDQEQDDVLTQLASALRDKYSVTVNNDVLAKVLSTGTQAN